MSETELESWIFEKNGVKYWQYKHGYSKLLKTIIRLRESPKRLHKDSDKQVVELLQQAVNTCQLWIDEMYNPELYLEVLD